MGWQKLTDTCKMPFGKYKGQLMQDVPVSYLHWLWQEGKKYQVGQDSVADYIKENLNALKMENKDLIWS